MKQSKLLDALSVLFIIGFFVVFIYWAISGLIAEAKYYKDHDCIDYWIVYSCKR